MRPGLVKNPASHCWAAAELWRHRFFRYILLVRKFMVKFKFDLLKEYAKHYKTDAKMNKNC